MNAQLQIFNDFNPTILEKFLDYHKSYPNVYENFKKLTFKAIRNKHKHFSARGLFQVMRFKMGGEIKKDGFKYNNNFTPFYVRLIEKDHPELKGFFEKRSSKADKLIS